MPQDETPGGNIGRSGGIVIVGHLTIFGQDPQNAPEVPSKLGNLEKLPKALVAMAECGLTLDNTSIARANVLTVRVLFQTLCPPILVRTT